MHAIFKREFRSYFQNVFGYVILAVYLLAAGACVGLINLLAGAPTLETSLGSLAIIFILIVPLLCSRSVAQDRHASQLLTSLPLRPFEIVMGKFFAALALLSTALPLFLLYALILCAFGTVHLLPTLICMLVFGLFSAAMIAFGMFLSSLAEHPVLSALAGIFGMLLLYFLPLIGSILPDSALFSMIFLVVLSLGAGGLAFAFTRNLPVSLAIAACGVLPSSLCYFFQSTFLEGLIPNLLTYLSPYSWYDCFYYNGVFELRAIVFYLSMIVFFLFLTTLRFGKRRRA